jgi:hypothetical protein
MSVTTLLQDGSLQTTGITAHAGGGFPNAVALQGPTFLIQIGTTATNGDSIRLPPPIPGKKYTVINGGAANANVFASSATGTINNLAVQTAVTVNAGSTGYFVPVTGSEVERWITVAA